MGIFSWYSNLVNKNFLLAVKNESSILMPEQGVAPLRAASGARVNADVRGVFRARSLRSFAVVLGFLTCSRLPLVPAVDGAGRGA